MLCVVLLALRVGGRCLLSFDVAGWLFVVVAGWCLLCGVWCVVCIGYCWLSIVVFCRLCVVGCGSACVVVRCSL